MTTVEQRAEDYVNKQWPEIKGKIRQAAIRGYIDGYMSAPHPYVQLGLNFD